MITFTDTIETKEQALAAANHHREMDMLVRGSYGEDDGRAFKGCSVGCTYKPFEGKVKASSLHALSEPVHGIPEWLTRLRDALFESVSENRKDDFHVQFVEAIPVGVSERQLEMKVKAPFMVVVLNTALSLFDHGKHPDVKKAVDRSIALWQRADIGSDGWKKEAAEARAEASAEASAVRAAASAAWAAASAAWAAASAVRAAASAAWAAASAGSNDHFADELLRLLRECKP